MIPLFAGYVGMAVYQSDPSKVFKMTDFEFARPDGFLVRFASGLVLRVREEEIDMPM